MSIFWGIDRRYFLTTGRSWTLDSRLRGNDEVCRSPGVETNHRVSGRRIDTIPVALSIMVFFALCCQCAATLAVIRRETNSWRWPLFTFTYMTLLAYVASLFVYQIGSRLS